MTSGPSCHEECGARLGEQVKAMRGRESFDGIRVLVVACLSPRMERTEVSPDCSRVLGPPSKAPTELPKKDKGVTRTKIRLDAASGRISERRTSPVPLRHL
jgi:hypothetical protein